MGDAALPGLSELEWRRFKGRGAIRGRRDGSVGVAGVDDEPRKEVGLKDRPRAVPLSFTMFDMA